MAEVTPKGTVVWAYLLCLMSEEDAKTARAYQGDQDALLRTQRHGSNYFQLVGCDYPGGLCWRRCYTF